MNNKLLMLMSKCLMRKLCMIMAVLLRSELKKGCIKKIHIIQIGITIIKSDMSNRQNMLKLKSSSTLLLEKWSKQEKTSSSTDLTKLMSLKLKSSSTLLLEKWSKQEKTSSSNQFTHHKFIMSNLFINNK